MSDEYLCKDCKHSFMSWQDRLSLAPKRYALRCRKAYKDVESDGNLVTGPSMTPAHYERCNLTRLPSSVCGKEAKLWEPKNEKKHMLLWLKKGT